MTAAQDLHPINRTLLSVVENQIARVQAVFVDLPHEMFIASPGADCNSIQGIGRHLILLRQFQMRLLGSALADRIDYPERDDTVEATLAKIDTATALLQRVIAEHDPDDWYREPTAEMLAAREGFPWPDDPTIVRLLRPLNDFTNHLGSIRAIRRILGDPAEQVQ